MYSIVERNQNRNNKKTVIDEAWKTESRLMSKIFWDKTPQKWDWHQTGLLFPCFSCLVPFLFQFPDFEEKIIKCNSSTIQQMWYSATCFHIIRPFLVHSKLIKLHANFYIFSEVTPQTPTIERGRPLTNPLPWRTSGTACLWLSEIWSLVTL